jgi:GNAT superfamily N-acetyltransferase
MKNTSQLNHMITIVKPVASADLPAIVEMLAEFAVFEGYTGEVRSTAESLGEAMMGRRPALRGFIAYRGDEAAGMILGCDGYSTFVAKPTLVIEDLYVRAGRRGGGVGYELISAFARHARDHGYAELRWRVLASNTPAVRFYGLIGTAFSSDRQDCTLSGAALKALASGAKSNVAPASPAAGSADP